MKTIIQICCVLAASLPAAAAPAKSPVSAEQWIRVGSYVDGGPIEVEKKSINTSGGITRAWWRTTFAEARPDGSVQERQLIAVDCGSGETTTLALIALAPDGSTIKDVREPAGAAMRRLRPATPGSTGEMVASAACRLRPPPRRE